MIIPVGFAQVSHIFRQAFTQRKAVVTYGIDYNAVDFPQNVVEDIHGEWITHVMPELTINTTLERTVLKEGPVSTGATYEFAVDFAGLSTDPVASPQVAYLVRKQTAMGGRENRGRMYIPGVAEANVDAGGTVASVTRTALQTAFTDFLAALATLDTPMVVLHSTSSAPTDVTTLVVDGLVATQRRRLRG